MSNFPSSWNTQVSMDISNSGDLLATASKARDEPAARVRIWDTRTFTCIGELSGHQNTCVSLSFSPDSQLLASTGRDRQLCIFGIADNSWQLLLCVQKAHKRIIWGCSWSHDGQFLATGSRDGEIKIWKISIESRSCECVCSFAHGEVPVTALSFLHGLNREEHILAVGFESGDVRVYSLVPDAAASRLTHRQIHEVPDRYAHGGLVKRVRWSPVSDGTSYKLASVGEDSTVRVFEFTI